MFSSKDDKKVAEDVSNSSNVIGKGTMLHGRVETFGNIRIDGKVSGDVTTKSKLVLGSSSEVNGNVLAQNAEIEGHIIGTVQVSELLVLKPTAIIDGDIIAGQILVEKGAMFNGNSKMGGSIKEIKIGESFKEPKGNLKAQTA